MSTTSPEWYQLRNLVSEASLILFGLLISGSIPIPVASAQPSDNLAPPASHQPNSGSPSAAALPRAIKVTVQVIDRDAGLPAEFDGLLKLIGGTPLSTGHPNAYRPPPPFLPLSDRAPTTSTFGGVLKSEQVATLLSTVKDRSRGGAPRVYVETVRLDGSSLEFPATGGSGLKPNAKVVPKLADEKGHTVDLLVTAPFGPTNENVVCIATIWNGQTATFFGLRAPLYLITAKVDE